MLYIKYNSGFYNANQNLTLSLERRKVNYRMHNYFVIKKKQIFIVIPNVKHIWHFM